MVVVADSNSRDEAGHLPQLVVAEPVEGRRRQAPAVVGHLWWLPQPQPPLQQPHGRQETVVANWHRGLLVGDMRRVRLLPPTPTIWQT